MKSLLLWFLTLAFLPSHIHALTKHERQSFIPWVKQLTMSEVIIEKFKNDKSLVITDKLVLKLKKNVKRLAELEKLFKEDVKFARGEIEKDEVINGVVTYFQLSAILMRKHAKQNEWQKVMLSMQAWSNFAASLVYEEASLVGMKVASVLRSLLLDELESFAKEYKAKVAENQVLPKWFQSYRSPYPIDRVVMGEAKRFLIQSSLPIAEKLATQLQRNPYQSAFDILTNSKLSMKDSERQFLEKLWTAKDIDLMKEEMNRINSLHVRFAAAAFELQKKQVPQSMQELKNAGFLEQIPTDYKTGNPMQLSL